MSTIAKSSIFYNNCEIIFTNQLLTQCENDLLCTHNNSNSLQDDLDVQGFLERYKTKISRTDVLSAIQNDELVSLLEDLIILSYNCYKSFENKKLNKTKLLFGILQFYKARVKTSLVASIFKTDLFQYAKSLFLDLDLAAIDGPLQVQGAEEAFSTMREFLNNFKNFRDSVLYQKIYKLCLFGMSYSLFDKIGINFEKAGYTKFEHEALKRKHDLKKPDIVYNLCDSLLFLCERGYQIIKTGSIQYLYHSSRTYSEFYDKAEELKRKSLLLHNPELFDFTESSFRDDLDTLLEQCKSISQFDSRMNSIESKQFKHLYNELQMLKFNMMTKRAAREHREVPYSILLYGDSGIGKSTIKDMLFYHFGKINNLDTDKTFCYTRNPVANFWDGFTTSQWCIVLDDVAFLHPNKAPNGDPSCTEFLQIINFVPFVPDQADLSDKGRTPLRAKLVIATTNTENLNAHYYFSCASAAQRRFPFIVEPKVKKEYQDINGMLDSSKTTVVAGEYPNYWDWTIKKVETLKASPINMGRPAPIKIIHNFTDVNDFLAWYSKSIVDFKQNQNRVSDSMEAIKQINICKMCYFAEHRCKCEIQLGIAEYHIMLSIFNFLSSIFYLILICITKTGQEWLVNMIIRVALRLTGIDTYIRYRQLLFSQMGERVHQYIGKHKIFLKYLTISSGILASGLLLRGLFEYFVNNLDVDLQGNECSKEKLPPTDKREDLGKKPEPMEVERENVWYQDDYELCSLDLTPQITSSKGMNRGDFVNMISNNVVHCTIDNKVGKRYNFKAFCIGGQFYVTNDHNIPDLYDFPNAMITVNTTSSKNGVNKNFSFHICEFDIRRSKPNDIAIMIFKNMPVKRSFLNYIPSNLKDCKNNGFYLSRSVDGQLLERNIKGICRIKVGYTSLPLFTGYSWKGETSVSTEFGDCGSILVADTELGYMIIGLHVAGRNDRVACIDLNTDLLKPLMEDQIIIQSGIPQLSAPSASRELGALSHKSVFRYIEHGNAEVYGSFIGYRVQPKTRVQLTPIAGELVDRGFQIKYEAPVMSGWAPWRIAAVDMCETNNMINSEKLNKCKLQYLENILNYISQEQLSKMLHVYDDFTALNGAQGVAYVDKIKRSTSAGNPWKKSKKYFLEAIPAQHGLQDPVEVTSEIRERCEHIIDEYKNCRRVHPNFCGHLKDEPVTHKKKLMGKTRVFTGAPFDWSLVVRKYLLSSIRLIQNNKFAFETAVGTNAQSVEWQEIYNYLHFAKLDDTSLQDDGRANMIAGDYKSFDKKMSAQVILEAFDILITLCVMSGNYTQEDVNVLHCIAHDTAFALIDFNGDLVQFFGSNPSGHPLTVIINSIVNSLYVRLAYMDLHPYWEIDDFNDNVRFISYGDDNVMMSKVEWFNHTTISNQLGKIGIVYTMADKEAESVPFLPMNSISFLKRKWVWNTELESYLAPLEEESIEKMLTVWVRSKSISAEEQVMAVISSAVREYFFHGKEMFNQKRTMLKEIVDIKNLTLWEKKSTFPTWDDLIYKFKTNSNKIQPNRYDMSNITEPDLKDEVLEVCPWDIQSNIEVYSIDCLIPSLFSNNCVLYMHELNLFSRFISIIGIYILNYVHLFRVFQRNRIEPFQIWWLISSICFSILQCLWDPEITLIVSYFVIWGRKVLSLRY
jgi:hypothetical protein